MNEQDLCGRRFGKLVVLQKAERPQQGKRGAACWLCRCDCGNETVVLGSNLRSGHTTSCGCKKTRDLTGQHIGRLTVVGRSDRYMSRGKRQVRLWECRCDCGNLTYKATDTLTSGAENSCAECAARHNAALARENAGYVDGTQLAKIQDMTPSAANTSGCRGVSFDRSKGLWEAIIIFRRKRKRLGYFKNYEDAVAARKQAENTVFGEFLDQYQESGRTGPSAPENAAILPGGHT